MEEINYSSIEQTPEVFYSRLSQLEQKLVRVTVDNLGKFLVQEGKTPFLIAGVGGVLRQAKPFDAKDIDLAITGLKYGTAHSFGDVITFTRMIQSYFEQLEMHIDDVKDMSDDGSGPLYGPLHFSTGSGPFRGLNSGKKGTIAGVPVETISKLEGFSQYSTKGLQVCYENSRPIDIQFVFNKTIDEWRANQVSGSYPEYDKKQVKNPNFFYSVLLEG